MLAVKNLAPCVLPGQMTQVNLSWGGVNGSLMNKANIIGEHVKLKDG